MRIAILATVAVAVATVIGCGNAANQPAEATKEQASSEPESATRVLDAYELIRSRLANDEAVSAAEFQNLAEAALAASQKYSAEAKKHLEELAASAESGASHADEGLDAGREAFSEASKHLIALLSAKPALIRDRYVFECPMAKSYPKWVQQSETVSNPYMGAAMATCGEASDWQL